MLDYPRFPPKMSYVLTQCRTQDPGVEGPFVACDRALTFLMEIFPTQGAAVALILMGRTKV